MPTDPDPHGKAYALALKLLKGQPHAVEGLRAKLVAKGLPTDAVTATLEKLKGLGYLDDAKHAQTEARRLLLENRSLQDAQARLEKGGLSTAAAAVALKAMAAELDYQETTAAAALVKQRKLEGLKAARFLAGRGFPLELCETYAPSPTPQD